MDYRIKKTGRSYRIYTISKTYQILTQLKMYLLTTCMLSFQVLLKDYFVIKNMAGFLVNLQFKLPTRDVLILKSNLKNLKKYLPTEFLRRKTRVISEIKRYGVSTLIIIHRSSRAKKSFIGKNDFMILSYAVRIMSRDVSQIECQLTPKISETFC